MALYRVEPEISASTDQNNKKIVTKTIEERWIEDIILFFPAGQRNAVKASVFLGDKQLVPNESGNFLGGDGFSRRAPIRKEVSSENPELEVRAFSNANTLSHEVIVDIVTLPVAIGKWKQNIAKIADVFSSPAQAVTSKAKNVSPLQGNEENTQEEQGED